MIRLQEHILYHEVQIIKGNLKTKDYKYLKNDYPPQDDMKTK